MKLEILNRLFEYIETKGLTQEEFGGKLMLSMAAVSAWRNGHSAPSGDRIIDILLTYEDLDANWLIRGKGSQNVTLNNKMSGHYKTAIYASRPRKRNRTSLYLCTPLFWLSLSLATLMQR